MEPGDIKSASIGKPQQSQAAKKKAAIPEQTANAAKKDISSTEQKTAAAKARYYTQNLNSASVEEIMSLKLDPTTLSDKDRFVYQLTKAYIDLGNSLIEHMKTGAEIIDDIELNFEGADLEGVKGSGIHDDVSPYFQSAIKLEESLDWSKLDIRGDYSNHEALGRKDLAYTKRIMEAIGRKIKFNFKKANLRGAKLDHFKFTPDSQFAEVDFTGASLRYVDFGSSLAGPEDYTEEDFKAKEAGRFEGVVFDKADLDHADMRRLDLRGLSFVGANMKLISLAEAKISGANMMGANLEKARLVAAGCRNTDNIRLQAGINEVLEGREIREVQNEGEVNNIAGIPLDYIKASNDFTNMNLCFATLSGDFSLGDLSGSTVFGYKFSMTGEFLEPKWPFADGIKRGELDAKYASFNDALKLLGADTSTIPREGLNGMSANGADFKDRDLSGFDLRGLDARGADFTGAKLDGAQIVGMKINGQTKINAAQIDSSHEGKRLNELGSRTTLSRLVQSDPDRAADSGIFIG